MVQIHRWVGWWRLVPFGLAKGIPAKKGLGGQGSVKCKPGSFGSQKEDKVTVVLRLLEKDLFLN